MTLEWYCERTFLEHLMFTMYEYGDSLQNPLYDSVRTHFDTLASTHPDVMLRVPVYVEDECLMVGILPSDFDGYVLRPERYREAVWRVVQCRKWYRVLAQQGVVV